MFRQTTSSRRLVVLGAAVLCGSLTLAGPANALCTVTSAWDDGSANTTLDLDYFDDTASKQFTLPVTATVNTGAWVGMSATAYGGCGSYVLLVNGTPDHTFNTCQPGWQSQRLTTPVASTVVTIGVADTDGTWLTGILFDVDTNRGGRSTMTQNGSSVSGELMWRLYVDAVVC